MANDCPHNDDPLKLVREGTSQDERAPAALSPDAAPVDARTIAHDIVFAQAYAGLLSRLRSWLPAHEQALNEGLGPNLMVVGECCAARHSLT